MSAKDQKLSFFDAVPKGHLSMIRHLSIDIIYLGERVVWIRGKTKIIAANGEGEEEPRPLAASLLRFLKGVEVSQPGKGLTVNEVKQIKTMIAGGPLQLSSA
jgi:hypothetical protein